LDSRAVSAPMPSNVELTSSISPVCSFVPASGAASRMLKPLLSVLNRYERIDRELILDSLAEEYR